MKSIHIILINIQHTFYNVYKLWYTVIIILYINLFFAFINYNYSLFNYYSHLGFNINILLNIENLNKLYQIQKVSVTKGNSFAPDSYIAKLSKPKNFVTKILSI